MEMKPLAPNTMIQNRYLIVHLIGSGGMGEVYLAVDQRLGNAVALKRTFNADRSDLSGAFEREARTLARLRHPVLPKVIDHFSENGEQYLVMEHMSGDDLSKRLESSKKPFPLNWVMFWADQLLDALNYLHSHEPPIIHRDIKPQNLKLTDENHIILLDFGLCKDSGDRPVTADGKSGSIIGYTPHFAPMEQIRGTGTNPRSDIYSLSATLYQLMTNVVPVDALARADTMLGSMPDPIVPLHEINSEVPSMVSDVILKGMEVSQEKRFGAAAEMQKALRRAYAQTQSAMSAKTIAFTADQSSNGSVEDTGQAATLDETMPSRAAATEILPITPEMLTQSQPVMGGESLDATVHMDTGELEDAVHRSQDAIHRSEAKTQLLQADEIPEVAPEEALPVAGETSAAEAAPPAAEALPPVAETTPVPEHEIETVVAGPRPPVAAQPAQTAGAPPAMETPHAAVVQPQAKKSRAGLIIGLLLGLLVFAGIVGAGGWYGYKKYFGAGKTANTNANVQPSPSPTEDAALNSNQNTNTVDERADSNTKPSSSPTPAVNSSVKTNPQSDRTTTAEKPKPTPGTKTTPKTKPRDDRTVILQ